MANADGEGAKAEAEFVEFFKALGEPSRLAVAGQIALGARSAAEIAAASGVGLPECLSALRYLERAGYLRVEGLGRDARYELDRERLRALAARTLESPRTKALDGATDERSRIIATFFRDGRLVQLPTGDKRWQVVLEEVAGKFDSGRVYSEKEVNLLLKEVHPDFATLRRQLVDRVFLNRADGVYWVGEGPRGEEKGPE
jgi:hypothetical protein